MRFLLRRSSLLTAAAALVAVIIGENVPAQPNPPPSVAPALRIKLTAEQEYIIREIIFEDSNVQKQNSAPESIDDVVPDYVRLYPIPSDVIQKCRRFVRSCSSLKMMKSSLSVRLIGASRT